MKNLVYMGNCLYKLHKKYKNHKNKSIVIIKKLGIFPKFFLWVEHFAFNNYYSLKSSLDNTVVIATQAHRRHPDLECFCL